MNLKKIIALALCVCMVLSFFPVSVFAEDWEDEVVLVDEEEYFEPQDEYVEEEIIIEEPADYVEYVEPAEELIVEDELPAEELIEEPAEELIEEPVAPATPVEEAAAPAAMTAELETAETFDAYDDNDVARIGQKGYTKIQDAVAAALTGVGNIVLLKELKDDAEQDVSIATSGDPVEITGDHTMRNVNVSGEAKSLKLSVKSIENLTVSAGTVWLTNTTVNGAVSVTGGELIVTGGELKGQVTINGGKVTLLNTNSSSERGISIEAGTLTIDGDGTYDTVLVNGTGNITGNIIGGTFGRVTKTLLADGYVTTDFDNEKTYGTGLVSPTDKEAMSGTGADRKYFNLTDTPDGVTPKLLKDASFTLTEENSSFSVELNGHKLEVNAGDGHYADSSVVGDVTTYVRKAAVAVIGEGTEAKYYDSLEAAIDAAYNGGTVELLTDVEYDVWNQNLGKGYNVGPTDLIIDGRNHTWTVHGLNGSANGNGNDLFHYANNLTVKNIVVEQRGDTTTSGAVTMMQGFGMNSGTLENVTIIGGRFGAVPSGSITVKNCTFDGMGTAVYWENEAGREHVITGTTFKNTKATDVMGNMIFQNNTIDSTATVNLGYNFTGAVLSETAQNSFTGNTIAGELDIYQNCDVEGNDLSAATIATKFDSRVEPVTAADLSDNYFGDNLENLPEQVVIASVKSSAEAGAGSTAVAAAVLNGEGKETFYATLADAVAAAGTGEDSKVISLMADIADAYEIAADQTLKVKHNGKKLNVTFEGNMVFGDLDEQSGVTTYVSSASAVAQIKDAEGNVKGTYRTFDDALSHAEANDVIVLKKDGTWTGEDPTKVPAFKVTIDIGGTDNTLTIEGAHQFENNSDVTIRNGKVFVTGKKTTNGANVSWGIFTDYYNGSTGTKLAFDNVTLTTATGITGLIGFDNGLTLNIKDSDLTVNEATHFAFYTCGSNVTIDNSEVKVVNSLTAVKPAGWPAEGAFDYGTYNITKSKIRVDGALNAAFYGINGTIAGSEITASVQASTAVDAHGNTKNNPGVFVQAESDNLTISNTTLNLTSGTGSAFAENNTDTDKVPILILNNATVTCGEGTVSGIVANVAVEGVTRSFTIFAEAAAYAFANDAVVDLQAAPAPGDAYPLTGNNTLQVKLNSFVTDATVLATAPEGKRVDASQPVDGVVTLSLADQKYNVSRLVSGHPEVVAWYKTFDLALADVQYGDGQFIVIKESHEHAFTAEGKRAMYVKAEGEGVAFTYTTPVGYEVKTRLDGSGSESTLYELTPITYTLTYDYDDATTTPENPATYTVETETFTLNAPEKTNYGFDGWYVDGAEDAVASVTITKGSTGNHSYKAKWVGNDLTVTIDGKGGVTEDSKSVIVLPKHYGDTFVITDYADTFTRSHYHQTGWFNHTTGNTYIPSTVTYNFTLEAQWEIDTNEVKFYNGELQYGDPQVINYNELATKPTTDPTAETGYHFSAWYEKKSDGTLKDEPFDFTTPITAPVNLYAKFDPNEHTAKFQARNDAGEIVTVLTESVNYGAVITVPENNPTRNGYTFSGWTPDVPDTMPDSNMTFTAVWTKNTYTITLDANGGTVDPNTKTYQITDTFNLPEPTYEQNAMVFTGWKVTTVAENNTNWELAKIYTANDEISGMYGDATLTAQWITAEAKLTTNNGTIVYKPTIDEALAELNGERSGWYTNNPFIVLNAANVTYDKLEKDNTLTLKLGEFGDTFTVLPLNNNGTTYNPEEPGDTYYVNDPTENEDGTVTYTTSDYVAYVKTQAFTYSQDNYGVWTAIPGLVTYTLYDTFAHAAADALTAPGGERPATVKTVVLLTANPTTYELTETALATAGELRIDVGTIGSANLKAEEGARIDVQNISGTEYRYSLVETVTVTFDMNGKTGTAPAALTIDKGAKATEPAAPTTTDGYTFTKWYAEAACTTEFDFNDAITEDTTVYAGWEATEYTIAYTGGAYTNPNAEITTYTVETRDSITFEDAVSYGWHFDGWKLNGALLQNGKLPAGTTGAITLEATWSKNNYNVTFVTPDGVVAPDAQSVPYNTKATNPGPINRNYYDFKGWYKSATPAATDTPFDFDTLITEATTLYAIYKPTDYTITCYLNGGSLDEGATTPVTYTYNYTVETETFNLQNPTKTNWTFDGWTSESQQDPGQSTITITKGTHGNLIYGAHYKYTATFVMNGGTPDVPAQTNMERVLVTRPADPTLTDATFQGWYTDAAFEHPFDFAIAPDGNVTLYAKFVGDPRSIVFMDDDYTHRIFQTLDKHVGDTLPAYVPDSLPTRTGYALDETDLWNPSIFDDQGNLKKVTTDQIFNLKWKQLFTVDFEANGIVIKSIENVKAGDTIAENLAPYARKDGKDAKWLLNGEPFGFGTTPVESNLTLVASWDDTPATLADFTYNMSLTENLNMKFYVRNVKDDFHNYTVKVSIDGEDDQFFYLDNAEENIIPIAEFDATRMTDKIHVVVTDGDTEALDEFYTIAGYCNAVIESTGNEKLKELANAILVYGANAQLALDYKTGNLPTEDHDVSGVIIPAATAKTKGSVTGVSRFGNQVMVDSYVTLRVLLQVDSTASLDDYTVTVNDTEVVPVKQSATIWYVDIPVSALKLGERQIVYVEDDDGMATYALTTIVPMKRVNNDLARALYAYYDAATAYATSI